MSKLKIIKNSSKFQLNNKIYSIIFLIILFIFILIKFNKEQNKSNKLIIFIYFNFLKASILTKKELIIKYGTDKYITINLITSDGCGGLGNMVLFIFFLIIYKLKMWRTASLLSIGKALNRTIYFETNYLCFYLYKEIFKEIFNNSHKIFKFMVIIFF
jgi:hypothetical protein